MMLKDNQGRTVLLRQHFDRTIHGCGSVTYSLLASAGENMVPVDEAIISEGDDSFISEEQVSKMLQDAGFTDVAFVLDVSQKWGCISFGLQHGYNPGAGFFTRPVSEYYHIGNKTTDKETFERLANLQSEVSEYGALKRMSVSIQKNIHLDMQNVLELIGVGETVTASSLVNGLAKGEQRHRILPGDSVTIKVRGKEVLGVIKSMKSKVTVLRQDGVKATVSYDAVQRTEASGHNESLASQVDASIADNFDYVLNQKQRLYRVKLEKGDMTYPMFPDTDQWGHQEHQIVKEGAMSCPCPVCGWRMADFRNNGEFICCFCRIRGMVISVSDVEVVLFMLRWPAKNRFAIKEARCCTNCGMFRFEVGRQGKRSTGYCQSSNQCVQGFNVCNLWFPRDASDYESNMKQNTTNLHFGVKDGRNTSRKDVRDTVYTEEDHTKEKERAAKAKVAYANAYQQFMDAMRKQASEVDLVEAMTPELSERWQKVLDDPC